MQRHSIKYFDKATLVHANLEAIRRNRNAWVEPQRLAALLSEYSASAIFPVEYALVHNGIELRCIVYMGSEEKSVMLDVTFELYQMLDDIKVVA